MQAAPGLDPGLRPVRRCLARHRTGARRRRERAGDGRRSRRRRPESRRRRLRQRARHRNGSQTTRPNPDSLRRLFGDATPVSSTKSFFGHTLGASGVLETIASLLLAGSGVIPPGLRMDAIREGCEPLDYVRNTPRKGRLATIMVNNFGFGRQQQLPDRAGGSQSGATAPSAPRARCRHGHGDRHRERRRRGSRPVPGRTGGRRLPGGGRPGERYRRRPLPRSAPHRSRAQVLRPQCAGDTLRRHRLGRSTGRRPGSLRPRPAFRPRQRGGLRRPEADGEVHGKRVRRRSRARERALLPDDDDERDGERLLAGVRGHGVHDHTVRRRRRAWRTRPNWRAAVARIVWP